MHLLSSQKLVLHLLTLLTLLASTNSTSEKERRSSSYIYNINNYILLI